MTVREQEIFMRGIVIGMRASQEFEIGLPVEKKIVQKSGATSNKKKSMKRIPWTEDEKKILIDNSTLSVKELHELIPNHRQNTIGAMRSFMGLRKERVEEVNNGLAKLGQ